MKRQLTRWQEDEFPVSIVRDQRDYRLETCLTRIELKVVPIPEKMAKWIRCSQNKAVKRRCITVMLGILPSIRMCLAR